MRRAPPEPPRPVRRALKSARQPSRLDGRDAGATVNSTDLRAAFRRLHREALESVARPLTGGGDWRHLAVPEPTRDELREREIRCRHRARLVQFAGGEPGSVNAGVRALFQGASGTGKTLAARLLANGLGTDVVSVDLASVVNKHIGETEKNLVCAFAHAEELDVILLLDQGDSLMTRRTDVGGANDRRANVETNYPLQRVESFDGILVVITNAGERIDGAFARRMDVVIEFPCSPSADQPAATGPPALTNPGPPETPSPASGNEPSSVSVSLDSSEHAHNERRDEGAPSAHLPVTTVAKARFIHYPQTRRSMLTRTRLWFLF